MNILISVLRDLLEFVTHLQLNIERTFLFLNMLLLHLPWFDHLHVLVVQVFKPLKLKYLLALGNKL
jgi:hypothetical protein